MFVDTRGMGKSQWPLRPVLLRRTKTVCSRSLTSLNGLCGRCRCDVTVPVVFNNVTSQWPLRPVSLRREGEIVYETYRFQVSMASAAGVAADYYVLQGRLSRWVSMASAADFAATAVAFHAAAAYQVSMASAAGVAATQHGFSAEKLELSQWPLRPVSLRREEKNGGNISGVSMASAAGVAATPRSAPADPRSVPSLNGLCGRCRCDPEMVGEGSRRLGLNGFCGRCRCDLNETAAPAAFVVSMASAAGVAATFIACFTAKRILSQWPLRPVSLRLAIIVRPKLAKVSMASAAGVAATLTSLMYESISSSQWPLRPVSLRRKRGQHES